MPELPYTDNTEVTKSQYGGHPGRLYGVEGQAGTSSSFRHVWCILFSVHFGFFFPVLFLQTRLDPSVPALNPFKFLHCVKLCATNLFTCFMFSFAHTAKVVLNISEPSYQEF